MNSNPISLQPPFCQPVCSNRSWFPLLIQALLTCAAQLPSTASAPPPSSFLNPRCPGLRCCLLHPTAAMGQHPTQVRTAALAMAICLPADLLVACAFILFACTKHFKASTKRVTWAGKGANTEGTAEDEALGLLAERAGVLQCRAEAQRGMGAGAGEACWQPENLSEMLSILPTYPRLSLSTWVRCWDCRRFLPRDSPGGRWGKPWSRARRCSGSSWERCTKVAHSNTPDKLAELLTWSPLWIWTVLSNNPGTALCTLQCSPAGFPSSDTPCTGHIIPGHVAQDAVGKCCNGLQLSLAAANPTKHAHTQKAIIMVLGRGFLLAAGRDPVPCMVLCRHRCSVSLGHRPEKDPQLRDFTQRCSTESIYLAGWRKQGTSRVPESEISKGPL